MITHAASVQISQEKSKSRLGKFKDWLRQLFSKGPGPASLRLFLLAILIDVVSVLCSFVFTAFSIPFMLVGSYVIGPHEAGAMLNVLIVPFGVLALAELASCLLGISLGLFGSFQTFWKRPFRFSNLLLSLAGFLANILLLGFDVAFVYVFSVLSGIVDY